ncbi:MAG: aminotransferase class V-fold PLP-dependent enzyme [Rhodospirillaceae bacterium]|nr:aminotransferase class V-fold PLP-dependent enzyme [Rhodospirillaceae bacterium]
MKDESFTPTKSDLDFGITPLFKSLTDNAKDSFPDKLPEFGIGERTTIEKLAPVVFGDAANLGSPNAFAHMDPPTPWITWVTTLWNASLNQNLLHPDVSPKAMLFEKQVIRWLSPLFGMNGGHMTPGSTISNLTALWVARDTMGVKDIVASKAAHLSIQKAANLLGLNLKKININAKGEMDLNSIPKDLSRSALVLTAGTTITGAIDNLNLEQNAAWVHVDAAWAGPLRISNKHGHLLKGVEHANSVAISGHKWFFQPKESGLILFRDTQSANKTISANSGYLSSANVGLLGSHGAIGLPLLATLMAWGKQGLIGRLEKTMELSVQLWTSLQNNPNVIVFDQPVTGVILWRPKDNIDTKELFTKMPIGSASLVTLNDKYWIRHVAANPQADVKALWKCIEKALISQS